MAGFFTYYSPSRPSAGDPGFSEGLGDDTVRLATIQGIGQEAQLGAVSTSDIVLDDPINDVGHSGDAITGLKQFAWDETAAPSGRRAIFRGYITDRNYRRGDADRSSLIQSVARQIDVTLADINAFLSFRKFTPNSVDSTSSFNRPAETDVARITALLAVDFLSTTLFNGLVASTNAVDMNANDYAGQSPADVLNDCAQQSGKNFFVFYDEAGTYTSGAGRYGLFYDLNESLVYPSNCSFSNVLAEINSTTVFGPSIDAELRKDPSRVVSEVLLSYDGGTVRRTETDIGYTTSTTYGYRTEYVTTSNVKTATIARARADRYLRTHASEDQTITFSVFMPRENVNDWLPGQYSTVRFQHLPGLTSAVNVRCVRRTVKQILDDDTHYTIDYEMTPMSTTAAACATVLGAIETATNTGSFTGAQNTSVPVTVSITPSASVPRLLIAYATARNGDNPVDHAMTTPSGYTLADQMNSATGAGPGSENWFYRGVLPFVASYRSIAAPSGAYAASNAYSSGYASTAWCAGQIAIRTSSGSLVQSYIRAESAGVFSQLLSAPTGGNLLLLIASQENMSAAPTPVQSGWTQLFTTHIEQPHNTSRKRQVTAFCRCYVAGEGYLTNGTQWTFTSVGTEMNLYWMAEIVIT